MPLLSGITPTLTLIVVFAIIPAHSAIQHELVATLEPAEHYLEVEDHIRLDEPTENVDFILHANLKLTSPDAQLEIGDATTENTWVPLRRYKVKLAKGQQSFTVRYSGEIHHPIAEFGAEYARSLVGTPGTIGKAGIFLSHTSYWYPYFENQLISFSLETRLPPDWESVSQGERTIHETSNKGNRIGWRETTPQEEIYLVAAPFVVYTQAAGTAQAMVYLRDEDATLAQQYLDATAQYLEMYSRLIGPYPYAKFALVENFWETGYGMPSFTLLGPKVIRLPFIIHSSYPHEILHNWWGNGVYVDYEMGNWAEGLTAYLSDHLIQEQRGRGAQYRRQLLQNYTDFVDANKDFPLTEFRSRHSSVTEVVGYGKTQMLFHMLRRQMGDEVFQKALRLLYTQHKFRSPSFDDLQVVFSRAAETDLVPIFDQWVRRTGSPQLIIKSATAEPTQEGFQLAAQIEQTQDGEYYVLDVPLAISLEGDEMAFETVVAMNDKRVKVNLHLSKRPTQLAVDRQFDLFRRLDREEIPPALSQAFGADQALFVLPQMAEQKLARGYKNLTENWQRTQASGLEVTWDSEIDSLPNDRAVWLFGWDNHFLPSLHGALERYNASAGRNEFSIDSKVYQRKRHSVVVTARNPNNPRHAIVWVATDNLVAISGLARKLPHYRKYSYLGFSGDEPTNIAKGQWPVDRSPMQLDVQQKDDAIVDVETANTTPRAPLAVLPPVFNETRMMNDTRGSHGKGGQTWPRQ